jgi:hypothetical protein
MNKKDQDFAHRGMLSKPLELLKHRGFSNSPPTGAAGEIKAGSGRASTLLVRMEDVILRRHGHMARVPAV